MKLFYFLVLVFTVTFSSAQTQIDWDGYYKLQLADFKSPATQIGNTHIYSLHSGSSFDFLFYMSSGEFMFTKNFNSRVNCSFKTNAASLVAPDTTTAFSLLAFAQYDFDLSELYARKFRKKLYEGKGAFSDVNFYQPIYNEVQKEYVERHALAVKETDIGRDAEKLQLLHQEVLAEIEALHEFCKTCKPEKKKK